MVVTSYRTAITWWSRQSSDPRPRLFTTGHNNHYHDTSGNCERHISLCEPEKDEATSQPRVAEEEQLEQAYQAPTTEKQAEEEQVEEEPAKEA